MVHSSFHLQTERYAFVLRNLKVLFFITRKIILQLWHIIFIEISRGVFLFRQILFNENDQIHACWFHLLLLCSSCVTTVSLMLQTSNGLIWICDEPLNLGLVWKFYLMMSTLQIIKPTTINYFNLQMSFMHTLVYTILRIIYSLSQLLCQKQTISFT